VRAYRESDEDALQARNLLKDWVREGFLSEAQYQPMEQETVCELRRTTLFLRLVLFLFTVIIAGAAVGLFFNLFLPQAAGQTTGTLLLMFAPISYAAAEFAVSRDRLYRYGIEEALAVFAVGFLCVGLQMALFSGRPYSPGPEASEFLVPAAGVIASLWIWHRFGLAYAALAAMIFAAAMPGYWTSSQSAQHVIVAAMFAAGLIVVAEVRSRYRFTYIDDEYSIFEALLWLGVYVAINLQISSSNLPGEWWGGLRTPAEFSRPFYWTTWVAIWCLPPAIFVRGLWRKDRLAIGAGAITAILTLITNKPYLGWPRHTWDPMILGALLAGVALFIRRWLAGGTDGIRHGFTAQRLSGKDRQWMNVGAAFSMVLPHSLTPAPQTGGIEVRFGGGDSGGGGASSDF
jgi:hypothetical protein